VSETRKITDTRPAKKVTVDRETAEVPSSASAEPEERRCSRCNTIVPADYHFCGACGFNLTGASDGQRYRDPLIGAVIGDRYRLLTRIGMGGMGSVYKSEHVRMGKIVAVKLLHGDLSRDESMIRRFTREARAASKLSSGHTVSVFDYGQSDGLVYLVMEYLQGRDLGQVLRATGTMGLAATSVILEQVAESLTEAHAKGIIHRDLKPENIFMCAGEGDEPVVKVLDFGLAKLREAREESLVDTARGNLIGTPYYMCPEQISGDEIDVRSDVYSLGAVAFKLLTNVPPFPHENPVVVLGRHLSAPIPRASDHQEELAPIDAVLAQALAKAPADRFPTVAAFSLAFTRAIEDPHSVEEPAIPRVDLGEISFEPVTTRKDFDRFERGLRLKRAAVSVAALAIVAGLAVAFWWGIINQGFIRSDFESEPNNTKATADRLFDGAWMAAYVGRPAVGEETEPDYFMIENTTGSNAVASIEVSGVPGVNLVLQTYTPSRENPLLKVDSGGMGRGELMPNQWVSEHYLYAMVRAYHVDGQASRHNMEIPYHIRVDLRRPLENEEREPNVDVGEAFALRLGEAATGLVGWDGDFDLFLAPDLPAEGAMVRVQLESGGEADLKLTLHDISYSPRADGRVPLRVFDSGGPGEGEAAYFFATSAQGHGVLYLGVSGASDEVAWPDDFYTLTVTYEPLPDLRPPRVDSPP